MISYEENGNKFNFRVSAIILDSTKKSILIHQIRDRNFWLLPGGRLEMLESSEQAISREMKEELNISTCKRKLGIISEDFFNFNGKSYHEMGFTYIITLPQNSPLLNKEGIFKGKEGEKYLFKWHKIDKIKELDFRPKFLIKEIESINQLDKIKQIVIDERPQQINMNVYNVKGIEK